MKESIRLTSKINFLISNGHFILFWSDLVVTPWISQTAFLISRVLQKRTFLVKSKVTISFWKSSFWNISCDLTFLQYHYIYSVQAAKVGLISSANITVSSDDNSWTISGWGFLNVIYMLFLYICFHLWFCVCVFVLFYFGFLNSLVNDAIYSGLLLLAWYEHWH